MSSKHLYVARIAGIPISLDYSWFLIVILLTWSLGASYFPSQFPGWTSWQYWLLGASATLLLFLSVLLHEFGHATVARWYHIPVREITLFIFGGVAQIQEEPHSARSEFLIAIAGPVVSLMLGVLFVALAFLALPAQLQALFRYVGYINISLFVFNLIPGFPLDGGRVLRAIIWGASNDTRKATIIAANVGRFFAYLFIFAGLAMIFAGDMYDGLWLAFIGWFLESAAVAQVQQQRLSDILSRYPVRQAMTTHVATIPAHLTLDVVAEQHLLEGGKRAYVVMEGNRPVGLLTAHQFKQAPRAQWPATTVAQVMIPLSEVKSIAPDDDLWTALSQMDRVGVNQLLVLDHGAIIGVLSREDIVSFLQQLAAMGV